jgi:hypothetical protein
MEILTKMLRANHALDTIQVARSTLGRPKSDCRDVTLTFFDPKQPLQTVRWIYRFTVDVSEVIPVMVGETARGKRGSNPVIKSCADSLSARQARFAEASLEAKAANP